ncbi:MAG: hypothetical protein HC918_13155 [Oscillatoriales cyanobacterium SM2_1_8]|nr:hypothetical protein [Oscillatoriales cyanobacterium SM2_1_8]
MNAADKALGIDLATKIAGTVTLFKSMFPAARADLRPWAADADTRSLVDPDSIDLSFSFPGVNRRIPSRCLLVQIRLFEGQAIGVEMAGFGFDGKQWTYSTIQEGRFAGDRLPPPEFGAAIAQFCRDVLALFRTGC